MSRIYHTDNMEASIIQMLENNDHCILLHRFWNKKSININMNDLKNVLTTVLDHRLNDHEERIAKWRRMRGLLDYRLKSLDSIPQCDSLLMVEAPTKMRTLDKIISPVKKEVIIYRPPTWVLHERSVNDKSPDSLEQSTILSAIEGFRGRRLEDKLKAAIDLSGYDIAFTSEELELITGQDRSTVRRVLGGKGIRRSTIRYTLLSPVIRPDTTDGEDVYDDIESSPDVWGGYRYLRFFNPTVKVKRLIRTGHLMRGDEIYVVKDGIHSPEGAFTEALANSHLGDWYRVKHIVDNSPKYPIGQTTMDYLHRIRSERHERSLFLAQIFGRADSTPEK